MIIGETDFRDVGCPVHLYPWGGLQVPVIMGRNFYLTHPPAFWIRWDHVSLNDDHRWLVAALRKTVSDTLERGSGCEAHLFLTSIARRLVPFQDRQVLITSLPDVQQGNREVRAAISMHVPGSVIRTGFLPIEDVCEMEEMGI